MQYACDRGRMYRRMLLSDAVGRDVLTRGAAVAAIPGTHRLLRFRNPVGRGTGTRRSAVWGMCLLLRAFSFCMRFRIGAGGQHPHTDLPVCIPGHMAS